ncbi:MAG: acylphosphatase [Euryarchaeota archaeon]|nr:acylphosphatase [Euryarchaeota archaeon]
MPDTVRKRFIVKGKVQHVGYRALVRAFAETLGLKGVVRNLPDKSVEVVCEGEPEAIASLLQMINRKGDPMKPMSIIVRSIEDCPPPPQVEYTDFVIDYGRKLTPVERESLDRDEIMILGAVTLDGDIGGVRTDLQGVGNGVRDVGSKVDCLGQKMDGVGKDVRDMHKDMNTRFDHMAQRYDHIGLSLVKAIDRMDAGFERMDRNSKRTDKAIEQSRKEAAAANRELAGAVKFMIRKLSDRPARKRPFGKRKRK